MNRIPGILRVGVGVSVGAGAGAGCVYTPLTDLHPPGAGAGARASAGVLAEPVRRHQAEVAAPK